MFGKLRDFMREHRAVRDFTVTGTMIVLGGLAASHVLATGLQGASNTLSSVIAVAKPQPQTTITRQVIRSVLDDDIVTGTTSAQRTIVLDPCTGEQKLPPR